MDTTALKIGFIPLCDSAPLIVARERGFFAEQGLSVTLTREASWANIRDKLALGLLDAAHMLATLPLSVSLGLGNIQAPLTVALGLSSGGNAITLGQRLLDRMLPASPLTGTTPTAAALKAALGQDGAPPPMLATVYPFSTHTYDLRHWLASGGIDPATDVRLTVVPPAQMVRQLAAGTIDGFCVGEPWNALAEQTRLGRVVATAEEIQPGRVEKVLAVHADRARTDPHTLSALTAAVLRACRWCDHPDNRAEVAEIISAPAYLNAPVNAVRTGLRRIHFDRSTLNRPAPEQADWYLGQMLRWGHLPAGTDAAAVAHSVYRPDLYDTAVAQFSTHA